MTYAQNVTLFNGEKIDNRFDDINKGDFSYYTTVEIL
jgi:hypothetical protein